MPVLPRVNLHFLDQSSVKARFGSTKWRMLQGLFQRPAGRIAYSAIDINCRLEPVAIFDDKRYVLITEKLESKDSFSMRS